jgi:hypothetical protein
LSMGVQPCCGFRVAYQEPTRRAVELREQFTSLTAWLLGSQR